MPYNFAADSFHTKKLRSRLSSSEVHFTRKSAVLGFWASPPKGGGATYDDHLRLIGKRVVDFLLVLIELLSLGVTAEALRANIVWKSVSSLQWGPVDPTFQVEGVAPTNHSSSQETMLNDLSYGIKIWIDLSSILSQITRLTYSLTDRRTDRWTDRRTEFSSLDRVCIPRSAVKTDLRTCMCQCIRLWALSRSHFLIDFRQNWHRRTNPQKYKNEFVGVDIVQSLPLSLPPKPYYRPRGSENACKYY